jgi:sugar phosphate isomerase/epimerase
MIHPGFITDELTQSYDLAVRVAVEMGVRHLEVRTFDNKTPSQITLADLREVDRINHAHGITVQVYCSPHGKVPVPRSEADIDDHARHLDTEVKRAQCVGAEYLRVFPYQRDTDFNLDSAATAWAKVLERVDVPAGILLFENGTISNAPSLELVAEFLKRLRNMSPRAAEMDIGILWDPGNSIFSGNPDNLDAQELPAALAQVRHLHIKDFADGAYVVLGEGTLDWNKIIDLLRASGFTGAASLETHARIGRVLNKTQRDMPWAQEFSDGGFIPTISSLLALRRLLETGPE